MWSLYMTILIAGYISGVYMVICPEPEDISPCKCKDKFWYIRVQCSSGMFSDMHDLKPLQQALSSLTGKQNVHLNLIDFDVSIPPNFFSGIGIHNLTFQSSRTDSLTNDEPGLLGLENYLVHLQISGSSIGSSKLNLGHLKKLETLTLYENKITELGDDLFTNVPTSLDYLLIERSNITRIGNNAFSELNNLEYFRLNDNRFGPIKRSMFPPTADALHSLQLENNGLTDLPIDIFSGMPIIDHVSLARNRITTLDENTWSPIWQQVTNVDLRGNKIVCDERLDWISKISSKPWVYGKCSAPENFKGMSLNDFFRRTNE